MALLNIPSVTKGTPATVTLDKALLMTLLSETSDPYYANANNIKTAIAQYRSTDGNQTKNMEFDLSQATPSSIFYTSTSAKDLFELQKIIVTDFDGGFIQIPKTSLPSGLNIDLSGGGGALNYVVWDTNLNSHVSESDGGIYSGNNVFAVASGISIASGADGEFVFIVNNLVSTPNDFAFGVGKQGTGGEANYFGFCWLGGQLRPLLGGSVPSSPLPVGLNTSGQLVARIAKEGSMMRAYIDNALVHTATLSNMNGFVPNFSTSALVPSVRTMGNTQNTGVISCYNTAASQLPTTLALYHLDGNSNGAYGNNLTTTGVLTYGTGKFNQAVVSGFDGSNYISGDASFFNVGSGDFTMECFTKFNSGGQPSQVLMSIQENIGPYYANRTYIVYSATQGQVYFYNRFGSIGNMPVSSIHNDGNWHHIAFQKSGNMCRVFLDGAFITQFFFSDTIPTSNTRLIIGVGEPGSGSERWGGGIDEIRLSNAAIYPTDGSSFAPILFPLN